VVTEDIERAWVATVRAATWTTVGVSSPAILNMFGIRRRLGSTVTPGWGPG
jgi:hypothetical protein